MSSFSCPKCGAPVSAETGIHFINCKYCGTTAFVDRSGVMFYYVLPFFVDEEKAKGIFRRWTANPKANKELESKAKITEIKKEYFPVYQFRRDVDGREKIYVKPAKGTVLPGMSQLIIPAGDIKIYDEKFNPGDAVALDVDFGMDAYLPELEGEGKEQALVYFPIYEFNYEFEGMTYKAVIDGSSGKIYTDNFPTRSSVPYGLVAMASFGIAFFGGLLGSLVSWIFYILVVAGCLVGYHFARQVTQVPKEQPAKAVKGVKNG
ncbi:transcription elongation factor Elf1 [Methanocalculus alkaliphilus]|uniref:zinc ribbon domain-containing protein n=1 Tax=Methanocalculus alkaliphilus TaxID=768730 RepID=UPI00209CFCE9|nr:zinc ribbon domain-containing protein [Methanocalculus alkaliphilus]MCP1715825.1 transcription elongation factor Elf1 [Methanocalculus alkaliphilus]